MSTPNLAITHILQSQAQKEVSANEAFDALDQALNDRATIDVSAGDTTVAADDFHRNVLLVLTGTPTAALDLTVPATKRLFVVQNECGQDVAVTTGVGAAVILTNGQRRLLYGDGTDVVAVAPDFASVGGGGSGAGGGFPVFKGALITRDDFVVAVDGELTMLFAHPLGIAAASELRIGRDGTTRFLDGRLRHLAYFPRRLGDDALRRLTA